MGTEFRKFYGKNRFVNWKPDHGILHGKKIRVDFFTEFVFHVFLITEKNPVGIFYHGKNQRNILSRKKSRRNISNKEKTLVNLIFLDSSFDFQPLKSSCAFCELMLCVFKA